MKVKFNDKQGTLTVIREKGDRRIYKESTLWYNILQALKARKLDVILKCPAKDQLFTHMTDAPYYIRSRNDRGKGRTLWVADDNYAIRCPTEPYNNNRTLTLHVTYDIFKLEGE